MEQDPRRRSLSFLWARKHYEMQEQDIDEQTALWEHIQQARHDLKAIHDAVNFLNPNLKYWNETLSKTKEIVVHREHRVYYAFLPTASCQVNLSYGAVTVAPTTAVSGWQAVSMPDGTKITLQAGNAADNIPMLVCVSNTPIVYGTNPVQF